MSYEAKRVGETQLKHFFKKDDAEVIILYGTGNLEWLETEESRSAPLKEYNDRLSGIKTSLKEG